MNNFYRFFDLKLIIYSSLLTILWFPFMGCKNPETQKEEIPMVYATAIGFILEKTGSYFLIFLLSGFAYLTSWIILKLGISETD